MKKLVLIFSLLLSTLSFSAEIENRWTAYYTKELTITCEYDHTMCEEVCGDRYFCVLPEKPCRDCMGTGPYMTYIFSEMGRMLVSGNEVSDYELIDLLKSGNFASINSKSVFNQFTSFNSPQLRKQFQSLCSEINDEYPLVFFEVDSVSYKLGEVKYVYCRDGKDSKILEMNNSGSFNLNLDNSLF